MSVRLLIVICFLTYPLLYGCANNNSEEISLSKVEGIAKEAYIYAYPMMQHYKVMYRSAIIGREGAPPKKFNRFSHRRKLLGPNFKLIVGPNNDTIYSSVWLDLRAEPLVISVPAVPDDRYYSLQLIDLYVNNFSYIGQRTTGSKAGDYVIVGPDHDIGDLNKTHNVIRSESSFVFIIGRVLIDGEEDLPNVIAIQDKFQVRPLSEFLDKGPSKKLSAVAFPAYDEELAQSDRFIDYLNFFLRFSEVHQSDKAMIKRFQLIGIGAQSGKSVNDLSPEYRRAIAAGVKAAHAEIAAMTGTFGKLINGWNQSGAGFGSRETRAGNLLARAAAAMTALYGNSRAENNSFIAFSDFNDMKLDGSKERYTIRFLPEEMPPVEAFWSVTMYRLPTMQLVENPIDRYSIGDRTKGLVFEKDGSLIFYLQHEPPVAEKTSNWLPAPNGPFAIALRLYRPSKAILNGEWKPPYLNVVGQ